MKHLNEMPPPPRSLRPGLPEPAEAAILKALAKKPADRFASAGALAAAFDAGISGLWAPELFPLPPVWAPNPVDTQMVQPTLASIVPVPEAPAQPNPLVLGSTPAPSFGAMPGANAPTQVNPAPIVYPQPRSRNLLSVLVLGALMIVIVFLSLLLLPELLALHSGSPTPAPTRQALPTSTSGITPTPTHGATPTLSPGASPTPGVSPTPLLKTSPTPGTTPTPMPTPTSGTTPTPIATSTPGTPPAPTPSSTP